MVWKCQNPECDYENDESEDFCIKCGLKKGSGAPIAPSPAISTPPEPQQTPAPAQPLESQPQAPAPNAPEASLELVKSSSPIANEFSVTNGKSLGRTMENEIALPDSYISRKHAKISFENGTYSIEDLGSTNGTFLNGNDIRGKGKQPLKHGDEIQLGTTAFRFKQT
jgi:pSer/pThr/pTyr-binding forkhead associated (FHA) protein